MSWSVEYSDFDVTGEIPAKNIRIKEVKFENYFIKVAVDEDNKFLSIQEVAIDLNELNKNNPTSAVSYIDVEDLYSE